MNTDTVALIDRPYQELVDDLLTSIAGGVVNEPIHFDVKEDSYRLSQNAAAVRGITGSYRAPGAAPGAATASHIAFLQGVDFAFNPLTSEVVWLPGGTWPEDETVFYVDYFVPNSTSPITDLNVGSVTRTIAEAIGREIATVYQQINQAYLAGFIDTATGQSLDLVVSILGITRQTADFATGLVTFFRDRTVDGNVVIPAGTVVTTAKAEGFATIELRTLQRGQDRIDIPVRALPALPGQKGVVAANTIVTLAVPVAGIARITNFDPTTQGGADENDDQLRTRARSALQGIGKGTLLALQEVVRAEGATLAGIWDPDGPPDRQSPVGTVQLLVQTEPERFLSLQDQIQQTRAAGVQTTVVANFVFFKPRLVATIAPGLTPPGQVKLVGQIIDALQAYTDGLGAGALAQGKDMLGAITKAAAQVKQARFVDVLTWRSDVQRPGPEATVDALVQAITETGTANADALRTALTNVLTQVGPAGPTSSRIPDQSRVQNLSGGPATAADLEKGQFQVAPVDNTWWLALDMEPGDVLLTEKTS